MSPIEHAPTETNGSIAYRHHRTRICRYTSTKALFFSIDTCAKLSTCPSKNLYFTEETLGRRTSEAGRYPAPAPIAILGAIC